MTKLVIVILTRDEGIHIERALRALQPISLDLQTIVVDSGSKDDTTRLATSYGATVLEHPFENYARQFAWALEQMPEDVDWIMRLDADEVIPAALAREINEVIPNLGDEVSSLAINRQHVFWGRPLRFGGRYPLKLVRMWRPGTAQIEQRWMDEHIIVNSGRTLELRERFLDWNLKDLAFFTAKHNSYATREAIDVILDPQAQQKNAAPLNRQARIKRILKTRIYNVTPFPIAAGAYFGYRYVIQLGFLDGLPGLVYHGLQGLWYRFLVGARVQELRRSIAGLHTHDQIAAKLSEVTGFKVD